MCGIAGCAHLLSRSGGCNISDQLATIRHRGPDSSGYFQNPTTTIGQSRLAIIDLITGDPPIENQDGTIAAVLNGEIYNYKSLQHAITAQGYQLSTSCDTEVLVHLIKDHSPLELASMLDGMFAFAIADGNKQRLILGRDRMGKKPLYYYHRDDLFVFGSEIKALLAHPNIPSQLNEDAIPAYLTFGYVPSPSTFYQNIFSLMPGHVLTRDDNGSITIERYWNPHSKQTSANNSAFTRSQLPSRAPAHLSARPNIDQAASKVGELLTASIAKRLISDVPLGAFLSGGIDSSVVVAIMSELMSEPVNTFTIGFDDTEGFDERPYAAQVARRYKTNHTEFVVKPDASELIEKLIYHHDGPFGDSSALPTYLLSELTKKHVTVALCGDGGDELFAGYERFAAALMLDKYDQLPTIVRNSVAKLTNSSYFGRLGSVANRASRVLSASGLSIEMAYLKWMSFIDPQSHRKLVPNGSTWGVDNYQSLWNESSSSFTKLQRLQLINIDSYLLDDLLPKVDRMAMANGLEVRSPFLDTELFEYAISLPDHYKVMGTSLKRVLRRSAKDLLPHEILHRKKHGFGIPLHRWFRNELKDFVTSNLVGQPPAGQEFAGPKFTGRPPALSSHLEISAVREIVDEHMAGKDNGHAIWTLLTLELFLRKQGWY